MAAEQTESVVESMEEIAAVNDVEYATIPGFRAGQTLRIGSLTAGDLIEWSEANDGEAKRTAGLRLITKSLVNSKNERYASDPKNIQVFRARSHKVTEKVVEAILDLNGMTPKRDAAAKNG